MRVVATHGYDRRVRKVLTPVERAAAELEIALAPTVWSVISGTGGARKARAVRGGGGTRIIYYPITRKVTDSRPQEWLLIEWPKGENEPTKYWLSTLPKNIPFRRLVDIAKLRWRIERDYQDLKQEVGLGHFEGRRWRGVHHHATLCIAACEFLISAREKISHSGPRPAMLFPELAVPNSYRPGGSALAA